MAGMRAGLIFPHISIFSDPSRFFGLLTGAVDSQTLINYESNVSVKAWVQLLHRTTAYFVLSISIYYYLQSKKYNIISSSTYTLIAIIFFQVLLGIITVIKCIGAVPAFWGAIHQGTALIFIIVVLWNKYKVVGEDL